MSDPTLAWTVDVGGESTSAEYDAADDERALFICAHGAGGNMHDRATAAAARAMREIGLGVVRFNFLYREKGTSGPDRMPKLIECYRAVVEHARRELAPRRLLIGGRSMGGRTASMLAAEGFDADGLVLLAYPLHPPGQHDKLRDAHFPAITMPVLCFNGTRDDFCDRALMETTLRRVPPTWTMHWLEHADHSFHVPKKSGRTDADVMDEVVRVTNAWLNAAG